MAGIATRLGYVVGVLALAAAVVLGFAPDLLAPVVDAGTVETAADGRLGRGLLAVGLVAASTLALWKGITAQPPARRPLVRDGDDRVDDALAGAEFDDDLQRAADRDGWTHRRSVRERCSAVAVETVAAVDGCDEAVAERRVATGVWTDDAVAAAFLGDERAPDPPLRWRLYRWLYADRAFERAVARTVDAVEAYERESTAYAAESADDAAAPSADANDESDADAATEATAVQAPDGGESGGDRR